MAKLESIEFENIAKFQAAIEKVLNGEEAFRTYKAKDGETKKKKIIANNRLYMGNGLSLNINKADTGKVYLSIDYFSVDDKIKLAQNKNKNSGDEV